MNEVNQFKEGGNVRLSVPLTHGFEKILFDLIQMTATKSGFDAQVSNQIAEQISKKIFGKVQTQFDQRNHQQVEISMSHCYGQIIIKTEILGLNFSEEVQFKAH